MKEKLDRKTHKQDLVEDLFLTTDMKYYETQKRK